MPHASGVGLQQLALCISLAVLQLHFILLVMQAHAHAHGHALNLLRSTAASTRASTAPPQHAPTSTSAPLGRSLVFSTVVRKYSVELTRTTHEGDDESALHTPESARSFRQAIAQGWPNASITWAFSFQALLSQEPNYVAIKSLVTAYISSYGDEMSFLPSGYFAPMYNTPQQTNRDIHDALQMIEAAVRGAGGAPGYRPRAIIAGYLSAASLEYLATVEGIHVAQATIFSQDGIDYGDGDGGVPYPYYPSTQHYLKPAQGPQDLVDVVVLDGWTVDFLAARRFGLQDGFNSRMGVGPIETLVDLGPPVGLQEMQFATALHFSTGYALNGMAFVTSIWELCLWPVANNSDLTLWLATTRARWPDAQLLTAGSFGQAWRAAHPKGNDWELRFVQVGSGIGGSDADKQLEWYFNPTFRLALLRNLSTTSYSSYLTSGSAYASTVAASKFGDRDVDDDDAHDSAGSTSALVIDLTRYDLPAAEPACCVRDWNLMNVINMKQTRGVQDTPRLLSQLSPDDQQLIRSVYPNLFIN